MSVTITEETMRAFRDKFYQHFRMPDYFLLPRHRREYIKGYQEQEFMRQVCTVCKINTRLISARMDVEAIWRPEPYQPYFCQTCTSAWRQHYALCLIVLSMENPYAYGDICISETEDPLWMYDIALADEKEVGNT